MTNHGPPCGHRTVYGDGVCHPCREARAQADQPPTEHVKDDRPEAEIRLDVRRWYEAHGAQVWDTEQNRPTRVTPGLSDLIVCVPDDSRLRRGIRYVEVKRTGGRQTDHQRLFQAAVEAGGGTYLLAYSVEDVEREESE